MKIMDILNTWKKEIFWMSVGAGLMIGVQAAVKHTRAKKSEKAKDLVDRFAEEKPEEPESPVGPQGEKGDYMEGLSDKRTIPPDLQDSVKEISQEEFEETSYGPTAHDRYELVYDDVEGIFAYEDGIDEDLGADNLTLRDMLGDLGSWYEDHASHERRYFSLRTGIYVSLIIGAVDEV